MHSLHVGTGIRHLMNMALLSFYFIIKNNISFTTLIFSFTLSSAHYTGQPLRMKSKREHLLIQRGEFLKATSYNSRCSPHKFYLQNFKSWENKTQDANAKQDMRLENGVSIASSKMKFNKGKSIRIHLEICLFTKRPKKFKNYQTTPISKKIHFIK